MILSSSWNLQSQGISLISLDWLLGRPDQNLVIPADKKIAPILLIGSESGSIFGRTWRFIAEVSDRTNLCVKRVNFYDGSTILGVSLIVDGIATIDVTGLTIGEHTIQAVCQDNHSIIWGLSNSILVKVKPSLELPENSK